MAFGTSKRNHSGSYSLGEHKDQIEIYEFRGVNCVFTLVSLIAFLFAVLHEPYYPETGKRISYIKGTKRKPDHYWKVSMNVSESTA